MNILKLLQVISDLSFLLIVIPPTIFVFGVTLLGEAIEKALQEEKLAEENASAEFAKQIKNLDKILSGAAKSKDTTEIRKQLEELERNKDNSDQKISQIRAKYARIDLSNTVVRPFLAFFVASLLSRALEIYPTSDIRVIILVLLSCFGLIAYGLSKIYMALYLVQEISKNKKARETLDRVRQMIKDALTEHYQGLNEEISLIFIGKTFPIHINTQEETNLRFRLSIKKGKIVKNVRVWFFIPDGFELIKPPETDSWRQASDYVVPNIRTVAVTIGNVSVGPYSLGSLKVKTPPETGKYTIRYKIYGDGYASPIQDCVIYVE